MASVRCHPYAPAGPWDQPLLAAAPGVHASPLTPPRGAGLLPQAAGPRGGSTREDPMPLDTWLGFVAASLAILLIPGRP